jgi:DNA binding domain, excisionase family
MTATVLPNPKTTPVLTVPEAAALLHVGRRQAYEAAQRGDLPGAFRVGRTWRVSTAKLLELLGAS